MPAASRPGTSCFSCGGAGEEAGPAVQSAAHGGGGGGGGGGGARRRHRGVRRGGGTCRCTASSEHMGTEQRADSNWTSQTAAMVQLNKDRQESHARRTEG